MQILTKCRIFEENIDRIVYVLKVFIQVFEDLNPLHVILAAK